MPLLKGKAEIGHNIKEMRKAGHPQDQSIAAALRTAGVPPKKHGEQDWKLIKNVEAFSVGEKRGRKYTPEDLKDIVENFHKYGKGQRPGFDVPAVLGHEETQEGQQKFLENTGIPAAGWIRDARQDGKKLYLDMEASPQLHKAIRDGRYGPVSIEIYDKPPEGLPGAKGKMMRRLAMLGGEIPQDKNLARMSAYSERLLLTTHLRDCIAHDGYVTCFSEVAMPSHEEMVAKLAEHGFDPEALKTHEGCMAEMMRMAETMKPAGGEETPPPGGHPNPGSGAAEMDFDHEPEPPGDDEQRRMYGETARKMSAYAEKLKKYAEPPAVSTETGMGKDHDMSKMSEEIKGFFRAEATALRSEITALRSEFKPVLERAAEDQQLEVLNFCEQMVAQGRLTPAQTDRKSPFSVINELLELNNTEVVAKFSENGRDVPLTKRKRRMEQIKRGPLVWKNSEVAAGSAGGVHKESQTDEESEIAKVRAFCEDPEHESFVRFSGGVEEVVKGFKAERKNRPGLKAADVLA